MRNLLLIPMLALLGFLITSCEKDELQVTPAIDEIAAQKANAVVPFHGVYYVDALVNICDLNGDMIPESICGSLDADGKARHLGKSNWISSTTIENALSDPGPLWDQDGDMTFTSADGSQLMGTYEGTYDGTGGSGSYEITSGNGRFTGATGSGTYFWIDNPDGLNYLEFNGTLTNP